MIPYEKQETLLSVKNLNLSFTIAKIGDIGKDGKKIEKKEDTLKNIFADVNFSVTNIVTPSYGVRGQIESIVGPSGAGKSMLIKALANLNTHGNLTGDILVYNKENILKPVKGGDMGLVFQNYYIPEHMRIERMLRKAAKKNVEFKGDKKLIKDAVDSYLNEFELMDHKDKFPLELSGGQKQRACIMMQLLNGSYFILLDEPFSGLDPLMIDKTTALLQKVANSDEKKTLIIISHDLENCCAISDTVHVLSKKGRAENAGSTIVDTIDLLERDLAYHPEIKRMTGFHSVIDEIKNYL